MARRNSPEADFDRRLILAAGAGTAVFATLVGRLSQLQLIESDRYTKLAAENHVRLVLAPPERGQILDRFARPLASQRQAGRVSVIPERLDDAEATLRQIAEHIDLPETRVKRVLEEIAASRIRRSGFVPVTVVQELSYEEFARLRVRAVEMEGVDVQMASTRSYPRGRDFAHILGYVARASADDLTRLAQGRAPEDLDTFEELFRHPDMRVGRQGM